MSTLKLLGISGALRQDSTNRMLLKEAARLFEDNTYTEADINLPLYDGDDEDADGVPAAVQTLGQQIADSDAVVISTPEYNKGPSGALKNALDWVSRVEGSPWAGKPVAVMAAAAGRAGGERATMTLRSFMQPFRTRILQGPELHLAASYEAFDENGQLKGKAYVRDLTRLMKDLRELAENS